MYTQFPRNVAVSIVASCSQVAFARMKLSYRRFHIPAKTKRSLPRACSTSSSSSSDSFNFFSGIDWDRAAKVFVEATSKYDVDEDKVLAVQLNMDMESELFKSYKEKIKKRLRDRAEELKQLQLKQPGQANFELGQKAYERGNYPRSVELFTAALDESGPYNKLGGDIQLWLALAYQACGREEECLALYRQVEASHPMPGIKKQAAELRYIMEAPKLVIGEDERVKIPVMDNLERNASRGGAVVKPRPPQAARGRERKKTLEEEFLENYTPPMFRVNKYVWVASSVVAVLLAYYSSILD